MAVYTVKKGEMEYLVAEGIAAPHAFTTRRGGVSTGHLSSLNLTMHRGDDPACVEENYRRLGAAVGFDMQKLVLTRQVHGDEIRVVTAEDCHGVDHHQYPPCDALVTNIPGVTLAVFTADCTPILLFDPVTGAVGAAHAGWRGTALDIAGKPWQRWWQHLVVRRKTSGQPLARILAPAASRPMGMCPKPWCRPLALQRKHISVPQAINFM
jgi:copper oxidase (laccase) domain-containing protein